MALWGGRFTQAADQRFKQFNDSLRFDYRLAEQDIVGSVAWSKALVTVGVLTAEEQAQLEEALNVLLEDVRARPQQILESDAEDIHSWVEGKLIDKVGQLGKKLHTGRSRNDQVATDLKLWCKDTVSELLTANRQLQSALVETAQNNQDAVMPGYTHLQRAQPVTFAHWCLAYVEMLALLIGSNLAPIVTSTAVSTGFSLPQGTTSISSVDYAGAMLPWAIIQSFHLKEIGVGILTLCTLALVLWNRRKLAQENEQPAEAATEAGK